MSSNRSLHVSTAAAFVAGAVFFLPVASASSADQFRAPERALAHWLDRIPLEDREPLNGWIGYLPPPLHTELKWVPEPPKSDGLSWSDYLGKVVVIQSWNVTSSDSAHKLNDAAKAVDAFSPTDVQLIALHTPHRAGDVERLISAAHARHQVVVDPKGDFCDLLGIYRTPVNLVIGPNGAVRYVGLNGDGLREAIGALLDEDPASAVCHGSRPIEVDAQPVAAAAFPPITGQVRGADLRGQRAPEFHAGTWLTPEAPDVTGTPTLVVFWRTSCPACINAIPHKNQLVEQFGDRLNIVAISLEQTAALEQGLSTRGISKDDFKYHVSADPSRRMMNVFRPTHVPTAALMDSNWIVRWQGNPSQLNARLVEQILRADEAGAGSATLVKRWQAEREGRAPAAQRDAQQARRQQPVATASGFPPIAGDARAAIDFRGRPGPAFQVNTWVNGEPERLGENVTVVEFWRTGCPHCINAIPKINELAEHFGDRVTIVGITNENEQALSRGLSSRNLSMDSFKYHIATDPGQTMQRAVSPRGVPFAMVFGSDWTVRWQGHPAQLSTQLLDQIVRADEAVRMAGSAPR